MCALGIVSFAAGCKNDGGGDGDESTSTTSPTTGDETSPGPTTEGDPTGSTQPGTDTDTIGTVTDPTTTDAESSESTTGSGVQCSDGANEVGELCFAPVMEILGGLPVAAIAAANVEDDSDVDIIVGHSTGVTVLGGDGNGGFQTIAELANGSVVSLSVGDLDDDGGADIVAAHGEEGRVSIAHNEEFGGFSTYEDLALDVPNAAPSAVAIEDFDGDGQPDIVAIDEAAARLYLWIATAPATYGTPLTLEIGGNPGDLAAGDLGGDAAPDVAVSNLGGTSVAILIFENGSFDIADSVLVGNGPRGLVITDLDGDGNDDLVTADGAGDSTSIAFGGVSGIGASTQYVAGPEPRDVATGDIDNDGTRDVVVSLGAANAVAVFLQGEGGAFLAGQWIATAPGPGAIAVNDFNGDGLGDVVIGSAAGGGSVSLLLSAPMVE